MKLRIHNSMALTSDDYFVLNEFTLVYVSSSARLLVYFPSHFSSVLYLTNGLLEEGARFGKIPNQSEIEREHWTSRRIWKEIET